jgi:SAM-dependent methyltransferase
MTLHILAPYVATPEDVVARMLDLASVGPADHVLDLGCGDGRVAIAAARDRGACGSGVDIEPYWIEESIRNAQNAGVADRVSFSAEDATRCKLESASVVFLYLVPWSMQMMAPRLRAELRPGARIVSLSFPIDNWTPARTDRFVDSAGTERVLYLWVVGAAALNSGAGQATISKPGMHRSLSDRRKK